MKILHLINSLNTGGAEKLILDTLPKYSKKGMEIDLAVLVDDNYPFLKALKQNFEGNIYILGSGSVYNPKTILPLSMLMKSYDLVHVHLFPAQYFAVIANSLNKHKPTLLFTEHSTSNRRIRTKLVRPLEKYIYNKYSKTICITQRLQQIIHRHTELSLDRLPIIMNGVDASKIYLSNPLTKSEISPLLSSEDQLIIQVSSMQYPKNQRTLIKALQFLPQKFKIMLVGDGVLRSELENFVSDLGFQNRVLFLGKRNDVPQLLKSSDYVVLSSHFEGLSLSSIEGMASGKPFIASDVPGLTDVVKGYGKLFQDNDAQGLADIILELDQNPTLYQEVVEKCQLRASEFDIDLMINQHIELYEEYKN